MRRWTTHPLWLLLLLPLWLAASQPSCDPTQPTAVVLADSSGHLLDRPYPSDELLTTEHTVELEGYPLAGPIIGQNFMTGWLGQVRSTVHGFSALTPIYFRFDGPLPHLRARYSSSPFSDIRLYSLDSRHWVPIRVRCIDDAKNDPYLFAHTLAILPDERHPLRPGERYAAVVRDRLANPAVGWTPPLEIEELDAAVATVFTVQDHAAELDALREATDAFLDANPQLLIPAELREVASLRLEQGTTCTGAPAEADCADQPATVQIVNFVAGGTQYTYLDDSAGTPDRTIDLTNDPMRVYQATIQTVAFQDPEGRPYQGPGLSILADTERTDGWIEFDAEGNLLAEPHPEPMRITVLVPREGSHHAVMTWRHGSGGDAYEPITRKNPDDNLLAVRTALAEAGAIVVGADLPLFGQRFPLIDGGYQSDLAIVNIPNLPAFRDNVRQGAVDDRVLYHFVTQVLPGLLGEGMVDTERIGAFGHSTGAQVVGLLGGLQRRGGPEASMMSGTGGFVSHAVLASDLLTLGGEVGDLILSLVGIEDPGDVTPAQIVGALLGVPQEAWDNIDRFHPIVIPFQLVIDGADPLAAAPATPIPVNVVHGVGDNRVPREAASWLARALRFGNLFECFPAGDYDGHFCPFREPVGHAEFARFVDSL